jgi:hypothetical protein
MNDVEVFCNEKGLTERVDLIKRGALVAQDPTAYEHVETLSEDEREALRFEAAHRWRHPLSLYFTIIVCSIGAAVQGWDQTGSNGANLSFPVVGRTMTNNDRDVMFRWLTHIRNSALVWARQQATQTRSATVGLLDSSMQVLTSEGEISSHDPPHVSFD